MHIAVRRLHGPAVILIGLSLAMCGPASATASARTRVARGTLNGECVGSDPTTIAYSGGGPFVTQSLTWTFVGYDLVCHTSDPTIRSAVEGGVVTGTLNCSQLGRATDAGPNTIRWSNGRRSVAVYTDTETLFTTYGTGVIIRGAYMGTRLSWRGAGAPFDWRICLSATPGETKAIWEGTMQIGNGL